MIVRAIAIQELRRIFLTPLAWVILAVVQFMLAISFFTLADQYQRDTANLVDHGITIVVIAGTLQSAGLLMIFLAPYLSMRLICEDRRTGTIQLLLSSPVSMTQIVLGKYLGVMCFYLCLIGLFCLMPLSLAFGTRLDYGLMASGLLGLLLQVAALTAIGMFMSTLSRQPVLAAVMTFAAVFLLWITHVLGRTGNNTLDAVFNYLSMQRHFNNLLSGIFSSIDVIYFLLLCSLFICLSVLRLDALRRVD